MYLGFTLCDDIMEKLGHEVAKVIKYREESHKLKLTPVHENITKLQSPLQNISSIRTAMFVSNIPHIIGFKVNLFAPSKFIPKLPKSYKVQNGKIVDRVIT